MAPDFRRHRGAHTGVAALTLTLALCALGPSLARAAAPACTPPAVCSAADFVTRLLVLANASAADVPQALGRAFGSELARHTHVFVSPRDEHAHRNEPVRFVQLGEQIQPLRFDRDGGCVPFAALEHGFAADGWQGGMNEVPGQVPRLWRFLKGRTQLLAHPASASSATARDCVQWLVISFR
jgi:hypothetical protein